MLTQNYEISLEWLCGSSHPISNAESSSSDAERQRRRDVEQCAKFKEAESTTKLYILFLLSYMLISEYLNVLFRFFLNQPKACFGKIQHFY